MPNKREFSGKEISYELIHLQDLMKSLGYNHSDLTIHQSMEMRAEIKATLEKYCGKQGEIQTFFKD